MQDDYQGTRGLIIPGPALPETAVIQLYTLLESSSLHQFTDLFQSLGIRETPFRTARQLNKAIAKQAPDILVAEFIYGFGNNYAGVNVSNLDVSLYTLQRHAPQAKLIVVADAAERPHVPKLEVLFDIDAILTLPVNRRDIREALEELVL